MQAGSAQPGHIQPAAAAPAHGDAFFAISAACSEPYLSSILHKLQSDMAVSAAFRFLLQRLLTLTV
jgi:hypothetical protein